MCQQRDTVKVVMLVSDDLKEELYVTNGYRCVKNLKHGWFTHIKYLDADKQPIRKNLIVWKIKVVK
jgi:hypothetical protein